MKKAANSNQDNPTIGTNMVYTKVTIDKKTGRVFKGEFDFTNEEVQRLLSISIFMKIIIVGNVIKM